MVHASGPRRLETGKTKNSRLALFGVWFSLFFWFCWSCCQISRSSSPLRLGRAPSSTDFTFHRCHWFLSGRSNSQSHRVIPASSTVTVTFTFTSATSCTPSFLSTWSPIVSLSSTVLRTPRRDAVSILTRSSRPHVFVSAVPPRFVVLRFLVASRLACFPWPHVELRRSSLLEGDLLS